jgi:hypothetical protein
MAKRKFTLELDTKVLARSGVFAGIAFVGLFLLGPIFDIQPAGRYILGVVILTLILSTAVFLLFHGIEEADE